MRPSRRSKQQERRFSITINYWEGEEERNLDLKSTYVSKHSRILSTGDAILSINHREWNASDPKGLSSFIGSLDFGPESLRTQEGFGLCGYRTKREGGEVKLRQTARRMRREWKTKNKKAYLANVWEQFGFDSVGSKKIVIPNILFLFKVSLITLKYDDCQTRSRGLRNQTRGFFFSTTGRISTNLEESIDQIELHRFTSLVECVS